MARLAGGDMAVLGEIYGRYGAPVKSFIARLLPGLDRADVEDVTHEVFLTLRETAARFRSDGRLDRWLFGIAAHKARGVWRRQRFRIARLWQRWSARPRDAGTALPPELRLDVERSLSRMPPEQREVLVLNAMEGLSGEEISGLLGIPLNTVWTRLHRARKRLVGACDPCVEPAPEEANEAAAPRANRGAGAGPTGERGARR